LREFNRLKKPLGFSCISPIIAAKIFASSDGIGKTKITLGKEGEGWPYSDTIKVAEKLGANVIARSSQQVLVDKTKSIFSTPAFMEEKKNFGKVFMGIDALVVSMRHSLRKPPTKRNIEQEDA